MPLLAIPALTKVSSRLTALGYLGGNIQLINLQKYGLFLCYYLMFVSGAVWFACTHLVLGSAGETERDRDAFRAEGKTGGV